MKPLSASKTKAITPKSRRNKYRPPYGNLVELNTCRVLFNAVGEDILADIVSDHLDLLNTSASVYEKNGDYALGIFASGWCRFLDQTSRNLCSTDDNKKALESGKWHCHESCWTEASKVATETGQPVDIECRGGIRVYAVPIWVGGEVVGSINLGYGDPPKDEERLHGIAKRYGVGVDELLKHAEAYESRPPYITEFAKNRLLTSAKLIGEIVKRTRAEYALEHEKHEKEMILDSLVELVVYQNLENKVLWANRAACESVDEKLEALVGHHCYEIWAGRQSACEDCPVIKAIKTKAPQTIEKTTSDGRYWHIQGYPVQQVNGIIVGAVELTLNITNHRRAEEEKKLLEAKLQRAQKLEAIGTLAGGIAHDFNNLLTGIQGNVSLMLMDIDFAHPYFERLKNIEKQVQGGARLTSRILGYARKGKYEVKPIDLNQLVKEVSDTLGSTRKEVKIHQELAEGLFAIEADQGQIEQVLLNLFINAADAMPYGGNLFLKTVNVTSEDMRGKLYEPKRGGYILLTVTDTGTGMDRNTIERIFDPFFTTKEMGRGTGLGLASAYGIIKAHSGYIDVESKKGHGTTFRIYLPASGKEVQKVVKTAEEYIGGTETVLLVDDEAFILEVGRDLLEAMGYRVLIARDGKEGVAVYQKNRDEIDIVILDMVMPYMSGSEIYERLKEINPDIKVLLASGFSIDGEATEILDRGCNGFIQKPFRINELMEKIGEILDKK
jgi:signal transduction histidine kinase/ActR/RegA family two-component response regulator/ligand-binding sensor protein